MLPKKIKELLENREFISVATCDFKGRPNAAPKFFLKFEHNFIYLVDYTIGMTWENLKVNPKASLSLMDPDTGGLQLPNDFGQKVMQDTASTLDFVKSFMDQSAQHKQEIIRKFSASGA